MARLLGPDPSTQAVGRQYVNRFVTIYTDEAATSLAGIAAYDPNAPTIPGSVIADSTVRVDSRGRIPLFWFPDGVTQLYGQVSRSGPMVQMVPNVNARLAVLGGGSGATILLDQTLTSDPGGGQQLRRLHLQYPVTSSNSDLERVYVDTASTTNELQCWRNEGGFLRGTPAAYYKDDALVRAVPRTDLVAQTGSALEIQNAARTATMWGRRWLDGKLVRNGVVMNDVLVLATGAAVPAGTPAGTVIVRT